MKELTGPGNTQRIEVSANLGIYPELQSMVRMTMVFGALEKVSDHMPVSPEGKPTNLVEDLFKSIPDLFWCY